MKNILCYGDSNTWGFVPGTFNLEKMSMERYPREVRWTGLLQKKLDTNYWVIEEGLNGRTTNVDSTELPITRNGKTFLPVCLYSQAPLDLVILFLGINDLKNEFNRRSEDIVNGIKELITIIQHSTFGPDMQSAPQILLIGYPLPSIENGFDGLFRNSIPRAKEFTTALGKVAQEYNCHYLDAAPFIKLSESWKPPKKKDKVEMKE